MKKWQVLIGTGIAGITIAIDFSIVNTCMADFQRELHASINQLQWVMSGFGILFCAFLVTLGRLGDIVGRRKLLYGGMLGFGLASLGAGFSTNIDFLIVMRALQGFFGASIFPCGMTLTAEAFPEEERGRALGIFGSLIGIGLAIGPVLGSLIVTILNWRWIFFINGPVIVLSYLICLNAVKESKLVITPAIDWLGAGLLVIFLGGLAFAINEGIALGWDSPLIIGAFILSLIAFITLIWVEKDHPYAILPLNLMLNKSWALALLIYIVSVSFAWPVAFIMPLYLHNILNYSTAVTGLMIAILTAMTILAPILSGYWYDKKNKYLTIHGLFFMAVLGLFLFTFLTPQGPVWLIVVSFLIFGFAWGMGNGIAMPVAMSQANYMDNAGVLSGALGTGLNMIAVLMLSIFTLVFQWQEKKYFALQLMQHTDFTSSQIVKFESLLSQPNQAMQYLSHQAMNAKELLFVFCHAFISGLRLGMGLLVALAILLWIAGSFLARQLK